MSDKAQGDETLEVEIENEKYTIPRKFAEYLANKQDEIKKDYTRFNAEIRQLNEKLKVKNTSSKDDNDNDKNDVDDEDIDSLIFTNPKKAVKKIAETVRETVNNDLNTKTSQENAQAQFWAEFYKSNKDLSKTDDSSLVEYLFSKNYNDFSNKTVEQVIKELGELSRKEILKISRRFNNYDDNDENRSIEPVLSISKREDRYKRHNNDDEQDFNSISEVIKKRRMDKLNSKMR